VASTARIADAAVAPVGTVVVPALDGSSVEGRAVEVGAFRRRDRRSSVLPLAIGFVLLASVVLRFFAHSALWLDEAQTVSIARLPLGRIPEGLRHDGAPPLYYYLLHFWMLAFGTGTRAVRVLSGLFGVASLPLAWHLGKRLGGRSTAWAATLLLATSPFAVRYSTENRMYSLVVLLTLGGALAVMRTLERPTTRSAAVVGAIAGLLMLAHYWALFLVAATGALVALRWRRTGSKGAAYVLTGMGGGAVAFLPWLPAFVFQSLHTATPWSAPPSFAGIASAISDYGGGDTSAGWALGILIFLLVLLGGWGRAGTNEMGTGQIVLELVPRPVVRPLVAATFCTIFLSLVGAMVSGSAITPRYTSAIFALWVVLAALGLQAVPAGSTRTSALALVVVLGLVASVGVDYRARTDAPRVADVLADRAEPGDVIAYCPDQLAPAVSRLLPAGLTQYTFPRWGSPDVVDWVDYRAHVQHTDVNGFASDLDAIAAGNRVWLVWSDKYSGTASACTALRAALVSTRGAESVALRPAGQADERATVLEFTARRLGAAGA
jgi:hypothetical protein